MTPLSWRHGGFASVAARYGTCAPASPTPPAEEAPIDWVITGAGAAIVAFAVFDIFHTLWHPSTSGMLSAQVARAMWRMSRAGSGRPRSTVGPWILVSVLAVWALLVVGGFALVYWPWMDGGFSFASGLRPEDRADVADSVYLSLVTFATLGYGDIVPTGNWLRFVSPLESLVGFVLLSASIAWVLQIYPALARRRALALQVRSLQQQRYADALPELDSSSAADTLNALANALGQVRMDLTQYAHSYYFSDDETTALASRVEYLAELAQRGSRSSRRDVQLAAATLSSSLDDLAELLDKEFVSGGDGTGEVLRAYREDHKVGREAQ